jgi:hypothetical protein
MIYGKSSKKILKKSLMSLVLQKIKKKNDLKKCQLIEQKIKEEFENDYKNLLMLRFLKKFLNECL